MSVDPIPVEDSPDKLHSILDPHGDSLLEAEYSVFITLDIGRHGTCDQQADAQQANSAILLIVAQWRVRTSLPVLT
jgi:hypothetical protein